MEHNKKIYLTSDGTKETGKKIIAYLEYLGGDNIMKKSGDAINHIYYYIDKDGYIDNTINDSYLIKRDYKHLDINDILFDDNYNVIGFKDDIKEDADDLDNTEECFEKIVNNILNKRT